MRGTRPPSNLRLFEINFRGYIGKLMKPAGVVGKKPDSKSSGAPDVAVSAVLTLV